MLVSGALCAQENKADTAAPEKAESEIVATPSATVTENPPTPSAAIPQSEEAKKVAEEPSIEPGNVTVNFKGADIKTVLAYISEVAGVDIVPAPDVKCEVDLKLSNKPWKTALDIIVRNYGFAYEREGDIIRVVTLNKLKMEELVTQAFSLDYSKARDIVSAVKDVVTERGKVVYDERTNTVLVTDIPTNIYKIGQIITRLDKQTLQVLIETLVIETKLGDDERLGIDWNVKVTAAGAKRPTTVPFDFFGQDNKTLDKLTPLSQTNAPTPTVVGGVGVVMVPPADFPLTALGSKGFPFAMQDNFTFGTLDFSEFSAVLEMIKKRSDAEVVANPRILTLNNQQANIHVGLNVILPKFERNATTGKMEITGYVVEATAYDEKTGKEETKGVKTGVTLKVTPHINEKFEIHMDLEPTISDDLKFQPIDPQGNVVALVINERTAKTQARIRDGDTIFIGGLIHETDEVVNKKVPIIGDVMGDVPYLGLLVSHKTTIKVKRELIFFVTVHITKDGERIKSSPEQDKAPKAEFTMSQNSYKGAKPSKKKPWAMNKIPFFQ
jgi:type IV pilus assembly protein PilQ